MKIGILTFHTARNYGAFLQCFSLFSKISETFPDAHVEIIDYTSKKLNDYYSDSDFISFKSQIASTKNVSLIVRIKVLIDFVFKKIGGGAEKEFNNKRNQSILEGQQYLRRSEVSVIGESEDDFEKAYGCRYDIIVVGSDAIWNNKQTETPNIYYLHSLNRNVKRVSYAASCYGMPYKSETSADMGYFKEAIEGFSYLGVRDTETENYIKLSGVENKIHHNCDPSLFLDLKKLPITLNDVKKKFAEKGIDFNKPIIGLMCGDWLAKVVREKLGNDYQYVALYQWNKYSDYYMDNLTPFEWALSFSLFQATFTHFFHGTMFSLKNGTLTYAIEKKSEYSKNYKTKIKDVLERLSLLDQYYVDTDLTDDVWNTIVQNVKMGVSQEYKNKIEMRIKSEAESLQGFLDAMRKLQNG